MELAVTLDELEPVEIPLIVGSYRTHRVRVRRHVGRVHQRQAHRIGQAVDMGSDDDRVSFGEIPTQRCDCRGDGFDPGQIVAGVELLRRVDDLGGEADPRTPSLRAISAASISSSTVALPSGSFPVKETMIA